MQTRRWILLLALMAAFWSLGTRPLAADGPPTATYTYDDAGRLVQVAYSDGTTISYDYDPAGNLLTRTVERSFEIYLPLVLRGYGN